MGKVRVHLFSDTHGYNIANLCNVNCDIRVIAGDLDHGWKNFGMYAVAPKVPTVIILGNHDYYGKSIDATQNLWRSLQIENLHYLENETIVIQGIRFIGATLWSDTNSSPEEATAMTRMIADYRYIRRNAITTEHITPADTTALFKVSIKYIEEQLKTKFDGPTIVVTHHLPTYNSVEPQWKGRESNKAFYSNQDRLILTYQPNFWFHGHSHSFFEGHMRNTEIRCNPRGFSDTPIEKFNPEYIVEV